MVRIANTNEKQSHWHTSEIDADVKYLIMPLTNMERTEIGNYAPTVRPEGSEKGERADDITWLSMMIMRASLKGTEGILDPDNDNKELEFRFQEVKISNRVKLDMCQKELFNKIPSDLLAEILKIVRSQNEVSKEDDEAINFTPDLSPEISSKHAETATVTTQDAPLKDEATESL